MYGSLVVDRRRRKITCRRLQTSILENNNSVVAEGDRSRVVIDKTDKKFTNSAYDGFEYITH